MVDICFYFQVHQPERLRKYQVFEIGNKHNYFDENKNREIIERTAKKCYLPTNNLMLELINKLDGKFRISYSLTGVYMDQIERFAPEVLDSFKKLADTGCVEFLSETYYHSLSYLYSKTEFTGQVEAHKKMIQKHFGQTPKVFRNTELIYNNELAHHIEGMGYDGILAEGWEHYLGWRSPNFVYTPTTCSKIKLLLKNYALSDDIAFRFSNHDWKEYPLSVEKYAQWVNAVNGNGTNVNLFMDYETFGEHQWSTTGIFRFMKMLPEELLKHPDNNFVTPSELIKKHDSRGELDIHNFLSWADVERDLSAWIGNKMQQISLQEVYAIEKYVKEMNDPVLLHDWEKLTTSDHYYYMCTKWFADGDVHKYFNPYDSPYDAFITFMNVLNDIVVRIKVAQERKRFVEDAGMDSNGQSGQNNENVYKLTSDKLHMNVGENPSRLLH